MTKHSETPVHEARPATLLFRDGTAAGTIYVRKIGGRIVEAYRGYDYGYVPLAPSLRNDPPCDEKHYHKAERNCASQGRQAQ